MKTNSCRGWKIGKWHWPRAINEALGHNTTGHLLISKQLSSVNGKWSVRVCVRARLRPPSAAVVVGAPVDVRPSNGARNEYSDKHCACVRKLIENGKRAPSNRQSSHLVFGHLGETSLEKECRLKMRPLYEKQITSAPAQSVGRARGKPRKGKTTDKHTQATQK